MRQRQRPTPGARDRERPSAHPCRPRRGRRRCGRTIFQRKCEPATRTSSSAIFDDFHPLQLHRRRFLVRVVVRERLEVLEAHGTARRPYASRGRRAAPSPTTTNGFANVAAPRDLIDVGSRGRAMTRASGATPFRSSARSHRPAVRGRCASAASASPGSVVAMSRCATWASAYAGIGAAGAVEPNLSRFVTVRMARSSSPGLSVRSFWIRQPL